MINNFEQPDFLQSYEEIDCKSFLSHSSGYCIIKGKEQNIGNK